VLKLKVKMYMKSGMSELEAYKKVLDEAQTTIKGLDQLLTAFVEKCPEAASELIF
jgi:uncharacterized protein YunC (DUF1805 family)